MFRTPTQDMLFSLEHVTNVNEVLNKAELGDLTPELMKAIVEELAKFGDNVIAPLNQLSDQKGVVLDGINVSTTPGFQDAYSQYVENGWGSIAFPERWGGQNLPSLMAILVGETLSSACLSFSTGTTLTTGAAKAIMAKGSSTQKNSLLAKLVSGEWTATMNLTEPSAGSDLSDMRAKAQPIGNGQYKIKGQKIYITYGDHDLSENIIHLVLARLPDAPTGTSGISMFLVPKYHINSDGTLGERNDVKCIGLEEKMGIHGSPTCTMAFGENDNCLGTLLGEENKGLRNMFVMMNSARLDVGVQGLGVSERAYQRALAYSLERRQGRLAGQKSGPQVPIIEHPDVRRMIYSMKALTEASRAICYNHAITEDLAHLKENENNKDIALLAGLLTPISKGWVTDRANDITSLGVQIHGGMGFIEETGAAQHMRDARILAIYEGTNGIQAMDLVGRKLQIDNGETISRLTKTISSFAIEVSNSNNDILQLIGHRLKTSADILSQSTSWLLEQAPTNPSGLLAGATAYLKQFGNVLGGYLLAKSAAAAYSLGQESEYSAEYLQGKIIIARFFAETFLPEADALIHEVCAGSGRLNHINPIHLTH